MLKKHQVFTPVNYIYELLDSVNYNKKIFGKKILENSCGDGQILVEIVKRYIKDGISCGKNSIEIANGLSADIYGFEIDPIQYKKCINNLNSILIENKIPRVNWKICNDDFIRWITDDCFDFIEVYTV